MMGLCGVCLLAAEAVFNIAPYSPGNEARTAADMAEYVRRTGNRTVLYSLTLHPEGRPATVKVDKALESYRRFRDACAGTDVRCGILLQAILGHWPRTDKEVEPWTRTVDSTGRIVRFCPLDPGFRAYIRDVAVRLAKEKPAFILSDDDVRSYSPNAECFCALHTAEYNRRMGTSYSPEELRKAVSDAAPGSRTAEAFLRLQRDTVKGVGELIREGIDSVDPAIPAGACQPGWEMEQRFAWEVAQAIAAKGQEPVLRIANGNYEERSAKDLPDFLTRGMGIYEFNRTHVPVIIEEADTYPHYLWSKSSTSMHAKHAAYRFVGLKGAKFWFVNAHHYGDWPICRNYTDVLAENAGFYRTVSEEVDRTVPYGLTIPCHTNFPTAHPLRSNGCPFVPRRTWASVLAGFVGGPFAVSSDITSDRVYAISGADDVARYSDGEVRELFRHRVLVDGQAAVALCARGFGDLLGVTAEKADVLFNCERDTESGMEYRLTKSDGVPRLSNPADGARELSYLGFAPYAGATEVERVAPGSVLYRNRLGGAAVTTAWHFDVSIDRIFGEPRKAWLNKALDALAGGEFPLVVMNEQDVLTLARRGTGYDLLFVTNLNFDPMKTVDVRCGVRPASVEALEGDGTWQAVPFRHENGCVRIGKSLACYGCAVFRIRR